MEGDHYPADQVHNLSEAGKPLLVRYDLAGVKKALTKEALAQRPPDMWRYRELLPVRKCADIVSLGEAMTPLIRLPKLAERLGGGEPDVIFYPTGGGTGLIGMWKAFAELEAIGFIGSKRPRMVAVQASGCAPMVRAFEAGTEHAPRWEDAHTIASGIRVPQAVGDFLILRAVRESKGFAIAVPAEKMSAALNEVAREEGLLLCPEGAATYAAYKQSLDDSRITTDDRVMLFNCATGLKYPLPKVDRTLDRHKPIDYAKL